MDRIAKGMSQAGRHPRECCTRQDSLLRRMTHSFKGIAAGVRHFLKGKEHPHSTPAR